MTYHVIEAYNLEQFTLLVQAALDAGYKLQGGVSMQMLIDPKTEEYSYFYAQAMTRDDREGPQDESLQGRHHDSANR